MKKLNKLIVSILLLSIVGGSCYFAGNNIGKKQSVSNSNSNGTVKDENLASETIAVVNLDEGSNPTNDSEKIYYGEKIVQFPDDDFVYTSLEDARKGIENGNYSAYIIIPGTFSDCVESLNKTPTQANFQYSINTELKGETQTKVLYRVLNFGESLNTDLSYMYLANILQEFHKAQDEASTVMDNDLKDKEAIDQVQASDLVEMVPIPELDREENTTKTLDVLDYMTTNSDLVNNIDEEYKKNIDDSMEQLTSLDNSSKTLAGTLNDLSKNIEKINLSEDEEGTVVYEKGEKSLEKNLTDFNFDLQTSKTDTLVETAKLEQQRSYIADALNASIENYNEQLNKEISELLLQHKSDLTASIPTLTCSPVEDSDGKQYEISCNTIEGEENPPVVTASIVNDDLDEIEKRRECLTGILSKLLSAKDETESKEVTLEGTVTIDIPKDDSDTDDESPEDEGTGSETPDPESPEDEGTGSETPDPESPEDEGTGSETPDPESPEDEGTGSETTDPESPEDEETGSETTDPESPEDEGTGSETPDPESPEDEGTGNETIETAVTLTDNVEFSKSIVTGLDECDADADLLEKINECGYSNAAEFLSNVVDGTIVLQPSTHLEIAGNIDELEAYIKLGSEHIDTNGDAYQITHFAGNILDEKSDSGLDNNKKSTLDEETSEPKTVANLLDSYKDQIEGVNPIIATIPEVNTQSVQDIVGNECISPLLNQTDKVKKVFDQRYLDEIAEINNYQDLLAKYNPEKDTSKIEDYVSQMETNGSALEESVSENNQEYVEYAEKVYETTDENLEVLQNNVEEAKETSDNAVTNGLASAKSEKANSSEENQRLMADFVAKLPFTRLGTMEYTQAYEFMANPLRLTQISNYQRLKDDVSIKANSDISQKTTQEKTVISKDYVKWILYSLLGITIIFLMIILLRQSNKFKKIVKNT